MTDYKPKIMSSEETIKLTESMARRIYQALKDLADRRCILVGERQPIKTFKGYEVKGCHVKIDGHLYIFVKPNLSIYEKIECVSHELGHHSRKHLSSKKHKTYEDMEISQREEDEADMVGYRLVRFLKCAIERGFLVYKRKRIRSPATKKWPPAP